LRGGLGKEENFSIENQRSFLCNTPKLKEVSEWQMTNSKPARSPLARIVPVTLL
jgi:hypothetical protein